VGRLGSAGGRGGAGGAEDFKKQIAAGTRITYVVKGPWDKPEINKLVKVMESKSPVTPSKADDESGIR
jgi:hypothetical protein